MNKAAPVILLLSLWVVATGCESQSTQARVHLRVFEVPTSVLRLHTSEENLYKLSDSAYSLSIVSPNELNAMLRSNGAKPRLLAERTRVVDDWPAVMDTWVYSPTAAGMGPDTLCTGGGAGSVGVRERGGNLEIRLDYIVNHHGPQSQKLIESKIFYERRYPEGQVLLFHAPFNASAGDPRLHVIAFEVTRANPMPMHTGPATPRPLADILAYR